MRSTLIVVRHAHRDTSEGREHDNGLSEKGRKQAKEFKKFFLDRYPDQTPVIFASPSLRCRETVTPIAQKRGIRVRISRLLEEQRMGERPESDRAFQIRVRKFYDWWRKTSAELIVVCSHGDWIPVFLELTTEGARELAKGEWVEVPGIFLPLGPTQK